MDYIQYRSSEMSPPPALRLWNGDKSLLIVLPYGQHSGDRHLRLFATLTPSRQSSGIWGKRKNNGGTWCHPKLLLSRLHRSGLPYCPGSQYPDCPSNAWLKGLVDKLKRNKVFAMWSQHTDFCTNISFIKL